MESVLIFGSNGFVGSYLAQEFMGNGYRVVASDLADGPLSDLQCDEYRKGDLLDELMVARTVKAVKPDIIVNLAAISSVGRSWELPQKTMSINVVGSLNVLEAAKELETTPKILTIGSSEEYAPSELPLDETAPLAANNPYGISKACQEQYSNIYAERFGMRIYKVRAFNHTGVGQTDIFVLPSFCKQVATIEASGKSGIVEVGNLEVKRDFSDVRDIVRAYRLLLESEYAGTVFNVGSGEARSLEELLFSIISNSTQDIRVQVCAERFRPSDNPLICCDRKKAQEMLGWEPKYRIEDTLGMMYRDFLGKIA